MSHSNSTSTFPALLQKRSSSPSLSRRSSKWTLISLGLILTFLLFTQRNTNLDDLVTPRYQDARRISAEELMSRPLSTNLQSVPKLFHQSWAKDELPERFERWSSSCRRQHEDWEWVLWTDEDNLKMVKRFFPWILDLYQNLPGPIYRADLVRNMYMYLFGGVYADLDMECLRPTDGIFYSYNVSTVSHRSQIITGRDGDDTRRAFFGRMGSHDKFPQSIPNAWMASPPGHPFFLYNLETTQKGLSAESMHDIPEAVTGPVALRNNIGSYKKGQSTQSLIESDIATNPSAKLFGKQSALAHDVEILPFHFIYPYSWSIDGEAFRPMCSAERPTFNAARCKEVIATDRWPSYAITYWSHTWSM